MTSFTWPGGKRAAVSLSFDDARASQIDTGLPILNAHGVRATFYVQPSNVGARLEGWKQAVAQGHEIGNHTLSHPCSGNFAWSRGNALEEYTLGAMEQEMLRANAYIEEALGVQPVTFAYPCGQTTVGRGLHAESYVPIVAKHFWAGRGYRAEACNDPNYADLAQAAGLGADDLSFGQLKPWLDLTANAGGWLMTCHHEVTDDGQRLSTRPDVLDAICRYVTDPANGIWVDTVRNIAAHVRMHRT